MKITIGRTDGKNMFDGNPIKVFDTKEEAYSFQQQLDGLENGEYYWDQIDNEQFYLSSNGKIELVINMEDAENCSHPGDCAYDIESLRQKPYIKRQLEKISAEDLLKELAEFGAWTADELMDNEVNLDRILWIACGDINEYSKNI